MASDVGLLFGFPSAVARRFGDDLSEGGYPYRVLGIHVLAQVMGKFVIFCSGNGSCDVNLALYMVLLCRDLPAIFNYYDKSFRRRKFSSANDTNHSLFTKPAENIALFMGSYFEIFPWLRELFQNVALIMVPSSDFSKVYIYQTPYTS